MRPSSGCCPVATYFVLRVAITPFILARDNVIRFAENFVMSIDFWRLFPYNFAYRKKKNLVKCSPGTSFMFDCHVIEPNVICQLPVRV